MDSQSVHRGIPEIDIGTEKIDPRAVGRLESAHEKTETADQRFDSGQTGEAGQKRGRGRPKGSKNGIKTGNAAHTQALVDLTGTLLTLHAAAAVYFREPLLALDPSEASGLSTAVSNVVRHYPLTLSQKYLDWGHLILALGSVYGPRVYELRQKYVSKRKSANAKIDADN